MEINTSPSVLDDWTSYIFPSPSKNITSSYQVTSLQFYSVPFSNEILLLQATPGAFSIYNTDTMCPIGRKHSTDGEMVRIARFMPIPMKEHILPNVLLLTSKLSLYSLQYEKYLHEIPFPIPLKEIIDIQTNPKTIAILTNHTIRLLDPHQEFNITHTITTSSNALALGPRWLAYSCPSEVPTSNRKSSLEEYSLTEVAQGVASGLYYFSKVARKGSSDMEGGSAVVVDCENQLNVATFNSHTSAITTLTFDPSGLLLVSSSAKGQTLHIHRVHDKTFLYRLHRGITHARIYQVSFSLDSKWISVTTTRGTSHLYAIRPEGGVVGGHTHGNINLDDQTQLDIAKSLLAQEAQKRGFAKQNAPEQANAIARLRHPDNAMIQVQWRDSALLIASGITLKHIQLTPLPVTSTNGAGHHSLELSVHVEIEKEVQLQHAASDVDKFKPKINKESNTLVELVTHHENSLPLWHHPKISFCATNRSGGSRFLNVKRHGPVPLSMDDVVIEPLAQGESPVFDGSSDEPFVPLLDLTASISHAVESSVEIHPIQKQLPNGQLQTVIQDGYFEK